MARCVRRSPADARWPHTFQSGTPRARSSKASRVFPHKSALSAELVGPDDEFQPAAWLGSVLGGPAGPHTG
jgi:hypothetical protein